MARNEQLIRQHKILQVLERLRYGATLEELRDTIVEELGLTSLHTRSIRRDLDALEAAGVGIISEENQRGRVWKLSRTDRSLRKVSISATEVISLSMGRELMLPLVGTQFWQGIETFWNKVQEQLPEGVWEHYQRYRRTLYVLGTPTKSYEKQQGILKTINRAIQEHRRVEIEYQSVGKPLSTRKIEPYAVAIYQSSIYVIGPDAVGNTTPRPVKHWKLDRFVKADALDEWYKVDPEINIDQHLGQSIGIFSGNQATEFKIRLSPAAAKWVHEDPWHPMQQIEPQDDGGCILSVPAYHPLDIISKVMALAGEAEVLEPESCREMMRDIIQKLADMHR